MTGLPPPRAGRRGHRRRYSTSLHCYRFGGDTEAQAVTPTAWASFCRWRPCFTARIGGWSRDHRSPWPWVKRRCDRGRPALGAARSGATTTSMAGAGREPPPRHAPARNQTHYIRPEGGKNQIQGASTSGRTRATRLRDEKERNQIHEAYAGGKEPHPALTRGENQNPHHNLNRRKPAPFNRRQHKCNIHGEQVHDPRTYEAAEK